jgi:hypothetical protein
LAQRTSDPSASRFQVAARFTSFEQPKGTTRFIQKQQFDKKYFLKKVCKKVA